MTDHAPTSILLLGSGVPLAETLDAWLRAQFATPLEIASVHTVPEVLAYLQSHRVDVILVDDTTAQAELRTIHTVSPTTAIIALAIGTEASALLCALRQGAHEVLSLRPSAEADHARTIERALARVNGRPGMLKERTTPVCEVQPSSRLIHDLNNLLTSINGFADLLLAQLPTDSPARMGAEQIRLAGKRATTLLKANTPTSAGPSAPSPSATSSAPSIIARAA